MSESRALTDALRRNRQRVACDRLAAQAPWLMREALDIVPAETSQNLDAEIRRLLGRLRPSEQGTLVVTRDVEMFRDAIERYFNARSAARFHVFLAHWTDAGALVLEAKYLSRHVSDILTFDGDTVYGCTEDVGEIFAVDRTVDDDDVTFEIFWSIP